MTRKCFPNSRVQLDLLSKCNQHDPMSEDNVMLERRQRRERYMGEATSEHARTRRQESAATADTFSSIIGLRPAAFWVNI